MATKIEISPVAEPPPNSSTATIGRYTAIAKSSITNMINTAGVSRLPRRFKSLSNLATIPDDEI
jgi:hypothetical protein